MKNEDKRQRLIDAAYKVFVRKGFTNASIKDIAKEADITPGLVHYYFKNKEALLFAVQNQVQQQYHKNYEQRDSSSPMETLQEIKSRAEKDADWYRWRYEIYSLGLKNPEIQQEVASILKEGRESLSKPLQSIVSGSEDTNAMASILLACFDGLALQKIVDDEFDIDGAYHLLLKLLEIYLKE